MRTLKEKGHVLVTTALLLVALLGFVALTADLGFLFTSRTGMQMAADAAALAGASTFVLQPLAQQPDTAEAAATGTALSQTVLSKDVLAPDVTVDVDLANSRVEVQLLRSEPTFFARAIGIDGADIGVTATAEASSRASGAGCIKPWFLPSSMIADLTVCDGLTGQAKQDCLQELSCGQCDEDPNDPTSNGMQLMLYNDGTDYKMTAYAPSRMGQVYYIRPLKPSQALAPSNFYSLRLPGNAGGNDYRDAIKTCQQNSSAFCATCYDLEAGNMIGPTVSGVNDLVDRDGDGFADDLLFPPSVTGDPLGRYCYGPTVGSCNFNGEPQLVTVPVWDVCATLPVGGCPSQSFCPDGKLSGATVSLRIAGFASLFVHGVEAGNDVKVTLMGVKGCESGAGLGEHVYGPLGIPVQLVAPATSE